MPNITVYIPKELFEALKRRHDINKSKIVSKALKKALVKENKQELKIEKGGT